jgi:anti-sigma B factor antagonist
MFDIKRGGTGQLRFSGRLDASQADRVREAMDNLNESCVLDFQELEYISSAGLGVLLGTQKRLSDNGQKLKLINLNKHIRDIFRVAGFDLVFDIE